MSWLAHPSLDDSLESSSPYLNSLNLPQRQAVLKTEGAVLILAGAGTGKTRVLTTRLAHILLTGLAYPSQILAVTFTNKAAQEMKERVSHLLQHSSEGMWLGTFHSLSVRILRTHAETVGLHPNFTILDTDDQLRLIKQLLKARDIDEKQTPARMVLSCISRWKDQALLPEQAKRSRRDIISDIYQDYQERLSILNSVDFGDLILHCLTLFKHHPDILKSYQQKFKYILVDEYQDTNTAQYLWLMLLVQGSGNLCCVGDDDQSIYGWRGAEVGNILKFEHDFPNAVIVRLEQNYRSTSHILGAASGLIAHNRERLGKTLWTEGGEGDPLVIRATWNSFEEARYVGDEIENRQRQGDKLGNMAVLVRAGFQTREFEECLLKLGIPYRVIGGLRFYERLEIRDALAYIRLVVQPDDVLAFERIINTPKRGIGQSTLQTMYGLAREQGISLTRAARDYAETTARGVIGTALRLFFANLDRWRTLLDTEPHAEVVKLILDESGYTAMWRQDKSADAPGRLENLKELVNAIADFDSLSGFLEHVSLVMDNNQQGQQDLVSLMTLHAAKGLEFDTVFLAGWEENLFPHARSLQENGQAGLEEERRLAYVGISRARHRAIVTYCHQRRMFQGGWQAALPSRFIKEIPLTHAQHIQANGLSRDSAGQPSSRSPMFEKNYQEKSGFVAPYPYPNPKVQESSFVVLHSFEIGSRVFHQKFGYGRVADFEGDKLEINFDQAGFKKVMADFVEKA